jgi:hypothetical protein
MSLYTCKRKWVHIKTGRRDLITLPGKIQFEESPAEREPPGRRDFLGCLDTESPLGIVVCVCAGRKEERAESVRLSPNGLEGGGGERERVGINCLLLPAQKSSWGLRRLRRREEREGESLPSGDYQESLEKREKTLLLRERLETKENQGTTTSGVEGPLKIYF